MSKDEVAANVLRIFDGCFFRAGQLVLATQDDSWLLELEIRLYRAIAGNAQAADALWWASKDLAGANRAAD